MNGAFRFALGKPQGTIICVTIAGIKISFINFYIFFSTNFRVQV